MKTINIFSLIVLLSGIFFLNACKPEAESINYGKDQCSFCKMNIVDNLHAAQFVTKKGKQFKFDAIECLVRDIAKKEETDIALFLVADYSHPGIMIDAEKANYIISPKIKSPMGANLSALADAETAARLQRDNGGDLYDWSGLKQKLAKK